MTYKPLTDDDYVWDDKLQRFVWSDARWELAESHTDRHENPVMVAITTLQADNDDESQDDKAANSARAA